MNSPLDSAWHLRSIKQNFILCNNKMLLPGVLLQLGHPSARWQEHGRKRSGVPCVEEKELSVGGLQATPHPNATVRNDYIATNSMLSECLGFLSDDICKTGLKR